MIKTIFFDFDGVLVESVDIKTEAFGKLFQKEGDAVVQAVLEHHRRNTGVSRFDKFRYIYATILKRKLDDREMERLCSDFERLVVDSVVEAPFVRGAEEFLRAHTKEFDCYVVSATPQQEIEMIIDRRGMAGFFKAVFGSPLSKTEAVARIIKGRPADPRYAVYIGDALSDHRAALENGVKFIARMQGNESVFSGIECMRVRDLTGIKELIDTL